MSTPNFSGICFESLVSRMEGVGYTVDDPSEHSINDLGLQDVVVSDPETGSKVLISYRLQDSVGSVEYKLTQAVITREILMRSHPDIQRAIFVLEGDGWSNRARGLYHEGGLLEQLTSLFSTPPVTEIMSMDEFTSELRSGRLIPRGTTYRSSSKTLVGSR